MVRDPELFTGTRPIIVFGLGFLIGFVIGLALGLGLAPGAQPTRALAATLWGA